MLRFIWLCAPWWRCRWLFQSVTTTVFLASCLTAWGVSPANYLQLAYDPFMEQPADAVLPPSPLELTEQNTNDPQPSEGGTAIPDLASSNDSASFTPIGQLTIRTKASTSLHSTSGVADSPALALPRSEYAIYYGSSSLGYPASRGCVASPISHRPLYFEDIELERFGNRPGYINVALCPAKFLVSITTLPLKVLRQPPNVCRTYQYRAEAGRR